MYSCPIAIVTITLFITIAKSRKMTDTKWGHRAYYMLVGGHGAYYMLAGSHTMKKVGNQ